MSQDIRDFATPSCQLLALGEPTHGEQAFSRIRNTFLARLAGRGFRSIALESDRIRGIAVDDFVRGGAGDLDTVVREGFSHGWGEQEANRRLVAWMREYNKGRPAGERLAFHGFDAPTENTSAPSPRAYLEHARDHLDLDLDIAGLAGDDERWSRDEAILDHTKSPGNTPEAQKLRAIGEDMLTELHTRGTGGSREAWIRAKTHLTAGLWLLRYHRQSAKPIDSQHLRMLRMLAMRDGLMAQNLLDIRAIEADRGPTLLFAHNSHVQRSASHMSMVDMNGDPLQLDWIGAGGILGALLDDRYVYIAGSLGRSEAKGLAAPGEDTYEGLLDRRIDTWGLTTTVRPGEIRADHEPRQGYFPLNAVTLDQTDAVLHIADPASAAG